MRLDQPESQWIKGVNNWQYSNEAIKNPQWYDKHQGPLKSSSFADAISRLFTPGYFNSWETFASTVHNKPSETCDYISLEYIHNVIHNATGGSYFTSAQIPKPPVGFQGLGLGHMSDVPVAAFDPIFWLHHCNIDRLCAMWQTLNWNMWFDDPQEKDPAPCDPLHPFHHDTQNSCWTSDSGRDWRHSNYQYDDLKDMPPGEPTPEFQASLRQHINKLYPSTSSIVAPIGYTLANDTFNDYVINVVYDRYALNGRAYSILFYIGEPTRDVKRSELPTALGPLEPDKVEKVLDHGLEWYFVALGGRQVEHSKFPDTEIAVLQGTGKHPVADHIMPRYGGYKKLTDATKNKPLGFGHEIGPNDLIRDDRLA